MLRAAWVAMAVLGAVLVVAVLDLALQANPLSAETRCAKRPFACGMVSGLAVTVFAVAAGFVFWSVLRKDRLVASYVKRAKNPPVELVDGVPTRSLSVPRTALFEMITEDLRSKASRPQLIVGAIGTGKTTALVGLTEALARAGAVPVPVDLDRADTELDFPELAQRTFLRQVRDRLLREDEGFGVWQRLLREGRLVVIADGLGKAVANAHDREAIIVRAMESALGADFGLVVAARPEDVPSGLNVATFDLPPLDLDETVDFVLQHGLHGVHGTDAIRAFVTATEATDTPFYLRYIAQLHEAGRLVGMDSGELSRFGLRIALLKEYVDAIRAGDLYRDATLLSASRDTLLAALTDAAYRSVVAGRDSIELSAELVRDARRAAVDMARLELIEAGGALVTFPQTILQAYLAATKLVQEDQYASVIKQLLLDASRPADVTVGIAGGILAGGDPARSEATATALLEAAHARRDGTRFALAASAADVATLLPIEARTRLEAGVRELVDACAATADNEDPPLDKVRLAARLAVGGRNDACEALWTLSLDGDYVVRLSAARHLATLGDQAAGVLRTRFEGDLDRVESELGTAREGGEPAIPVHAPVRQLEAEVQCWILPTLHVTVGEERGWSGALLDRWSQIGWRAAYPGMEASLAQGLKFAAMHPAALDCAPELIRWSKALLADARFWYSRINLLHAITLLGVRADPATPPDEVVKSAETDKHPLVARVAQLCARAEVGAVVWADEVEVSRRADSGPRASLAAYGWRRLEPEALKTMAEVIVALNLIEGDSRVGDDGGSRLESVCDDGAALRLPECLSEGGEHRDRLQVRGTTALTVSRCPETCGLRLCPYPARSEPTFRGELNEAFCRGQASVYGSRTMMREFWGDMEFRAHS